MSHSDPTHPAGEATPIDLMALLGRCLGNFKMVERVLTTFHNTGSLDLNQLEGAIDAADFPAVVEIAHRFKGAASNVSATRLRELLIQTEQVGRNQNQAELILILVQLRSEWEAFERYSQAFAPTTNTVTK